jgi:DNA repair protein RadC
MAGLEHEEFACALLDTQHKLIRYERLFRGTIDEAPVYPRELVKLGLACNAAAIVIAHNHTSDCLVPSEADKNITKTLVEALSLVKIRVLDHVLVNAPGGTLSFAESGLI